ncbi:MAG: hypothetical protein GEU95_00130 [Rhizobiales bacterium]|nr:hypothetical protein [Hyphomicrobiales bacterium]
MRVAGTTGEAARNHSSQIGERSLHVRLERQRGFKSFLTWAFFLSQVTAAELLLTGAAKAQEDEHSENSPTYSEAPSDELSNDAPQIKNVDVVEPEIIAPTSSAAIAPHVAPHLDTPFQTHPLPLSPIAGQAPPTGAGSAAGSGSQGRVGSAGSVDSSPPTQLPDIGLTERTPPPSIDIDIGLTPLLGFDVNIETDGLIAGVGLDLNNLVNNLVIDPLQEASDVVDSLVTDLGTLLTNDLLGLDGLLGSGSESSSSSLIELTGLNLTDTIAGLLDTLNDATSGETAAAPSDSNAATSSQAATLITDPDELSAPDILSSGDIISFAEHTLAAVNDLFAQGQHTDYKIALHDDATLDARETSPMQPDVASAPPAAPIPQDDAQHNDSAAIVLSPFDELVTRPAV